MLTYHTPIDAPDLRALGIPAPWSFGLADRVRFAKSTPWATSTTPPT
jgi:acyl-CoA thioester hydrolase